MDREKFCDRCDLIIRLAFYAFIYFIPISIALTETFAGIACVCWFVKRGFIFSWTLKDAPKQSKTFKFILLEFFKIFKPLHKPLNWPLALFIFANGFSTIFSHYPLLSAKAFFAKILQQTYVYVTFIEGFKTKKQLRAFMAVFMISATLACVNGVYQASTTEGFLRGHVLLENRVLSSFRHPNDFASYLLPIMMIVITFFGFWYFKKFKTGSPELAEPFFPVKKNLPLSRLFLVILLILAAFNLVATFSRGAWLSLLFGILVLVRFDWKRGLPIVLCAILFFWVAMPYMKIIRNVSMISDNVTLEEEMKVLEEQGLIDEDGKLKSDKPKRKEVAQVGVKVKSVVLEAKPEIKIIEKKVPVEQPSMVKVIKGRFDDFVNKVKNFGGMGRTQFWLDAMYIVYKNPIFGCGLNGYSQYGKDTQLNSTAYPHNCFLQMTAEIGLVGILTFIWFLNVFFRGAWASIKTVRGIFLKSLLLGGISGSAAFLAHSFFDTNLYSVQLSNYIWLIVGIVVAIQRLPDAEKR